MGKLLLAVAAVIALTGAANARTTDNTLFTCDGILHKEVGGYEIREAREATDDYPYPMYCYIDKDLTAKILRVCRVGEQCVVSAVGETGNGGGHVIKKVLAVRGAAKEEQQIATGGEPIGWMKSSDVGCTVLEGKTICNALDHYTDVYQRGGICATYVVPFYNRPGGKPVGLIWGEMQIVLGEKSTDGKYTRVWTQPDVHVKDAAGMFPYTLKTLRGCG
jgi:hypothetical protein